MQSAIGVCVFMSDCHVFACFVPAIDEYGHNMSALCEEASQPTIIRLHDEHLAHRLARVLRLRPQESCILFGLRYACIVLLRDIRSETVHCSLMRVHPLTPLRPLIHLWLPFLERASLEEAVYAATVMGVHTISLIRTAKEKRSSLGHHEQERLQRIMISASEQSKQFFLPTITELHQWTNNIPTTGCIIGDGEAVHTLVQKFEGQSSLPLYTLIIGPEGDFSQHEKDLLSQIPSVIRCTFAPSVLRSHDAVMVGLGLLRNMTCTIHE